MKLMFVLHWTDWINNIKKNFKNIFLKSIPRSQKILENVLLKTVISYTQHQNANGMQIMNVQNALLLWPQHKASHWNQFLGSYILFFLLTNVQNVRFRLREYQDVLIWLVHVAMSFAGFALKIICKITTTYIQFMNQNSVLRYLSVK